MESSGGHLEAWISEHGDYLFSYALGRLHDRELARDLIQDTLLAACRGIQGFEGKSSPRTWLVSILKHKIADHVRHQVRTEQMQEDVGTDPTSEWFGSDGHWVDAPRAWRDNPEALCENSDFRKVLKACIGQLPDVQREVFILRELDDDNSDSICKKLGLSSSNLHVLMHRARMALRSCLEAHWFGSAGHEGRS